MDHTDNLLKGGFHSLEGLGRTGARENSLGEADHPTMHVEKVKSDEYDSFTLKVIGAPQVVVRYDPARKSCRMRNLSAANCVVGNLSKVSAGGGYLLTNGDTLTVETTGDIWIGPETPNFTGDTAYVPVWVERETE